MYQRIEIINFIPCTDNSVILCNNYVYTVNHSTVIIALYHIVYLYCVFIITRINTYTYATFYLRILKILPCMYLCGKQLYL